VYNSIPALALNLQQWPNDLAYYIYITVINGKITVINGKITVINGKITV